MSKAGRWPREDLYSHQSAAWAAYHRQTAVLQEVVARIERNPEGELPWAEVPGVPETFGERDTLLLALQKRWESRVRGQVEMLLEMGEDDVADEVVHALRDAAAAQPGLRRFLDRYAAHPALQHVVREEKRFLAVNAGLATFDTPTSIAVAAGAALLAEVRVPQPRNVPRRERLLSVLRGGRAVPAPDSLS
jgi:hypothetical protein